jgi:hypothetical protein
VNAATVHLNGAGLSVDATESHPEGMLFSGGYDADTNELFLASVMGHPRGVSLAGGDPSKQTVSGLRVLILRDRQVYWATDSMSLPRGLSEDESLAVQAGLEAHFNPQIVRRAAALEDVPR